MSYLDVFCAETQKETTVVWYFTSAPSGFSKQSISNQKKILKFRIKIALIGYFWIEFQKYNVVFQINILESIDMQSFIKNKKNLNLGPKIHYLDIFGLQFNKNYYQIFNQHPRIRENFKFHPKQKNILVFGEKNALFPSLDWKIEKLLSCL